MGAEKQSFEAELAFAILDNFATEYNAAAYEKDPTRRNAIIKGAEQLIECRLRQRGSLSAGTSACAGG
jgi:hypothetical protein